MTTKTTPRTPTKIPILSPKRVSQYPIVTLINNSNQKVQYKNYKVISINQLLEDSVKFLHFQNLPTKIFAQNGNAIKSLKDITDKKALYISCGEEFLTPAQLTPKKPQVIDENDEQEANIVPFSPFSSFIKQRKDKEEQERKEAQEREDAMKKSKEVKEDVKQLTQEQKNLAIFSIFASVSPENRGRIPGYKTINEDYRSYKLKLLTEHIAYSRLFNHISCKDITKQLYDMSIKAIADTKLQDIQYIYTGPTNTGKSSLLYETALNLFKKITISDMEDKVLFVPLNFSLFDFSNPIHIYRSITEAIARSLSYCFVQITPFYKEITKAFDDVLKDPGVPLLPPQLASIPNLSLPKFTKCLKTVYKAYHSRTGLEDFVKSTLYLPISIAQAFGLTPFFLIDNLSKCCVTLSNIKIFPDSMSEVSIEGIVRDILNQCPYIAANQDAFHLETTDISLQKIVELKDIKSISCVNPVLSLSVDDCNGYPGYIDQYLSIVNDISNFAEKQVESNYSKAMASVDKSRMIMIKAKINKLLSSIDANRFGDFLSKVEDVRFPIFELV